MMLIVSKLNDAIKHSIIVASYKLISIMASSFFLLQKLFDFDFVCWVIRK